MEQLFQDITQWYMSHMNYGTIVFLMAIESSFIPFPSEIVIPPAAFKAAQGNLNIWLVILSGSAGALIGALFNYYIAISLGRVIIYRLANTRVAAMLMIDPPAIEKAERYFNRHGKSSTLIGRLVPVIRQLISLPAGLAKMNIRDFIVFTVIGSTLWNIALAALGYYLFSQQEILHKYYVEISYLFVLLGIAFVAYLIYRGIRKGKQPA
jgi:membrane protein DedA with SNARE-associated domain